MLLAVWVTEENRNATRQQPRTFGLETRPRSFGLLISSSERMWGRSSRLDRRGRGMRYMLCLLITPNGSPRTRNRLFKRSVLFVPSTSPPYGSSPATPRVLPPIPPHPTIINFIPRRDVLDIGIRTGRSLHLSGRPPSPPVLLEMHHISLAPTSRSSFYEPALRQRPGVYRGGAVCALGPLDRNLRQYVQVLNILQRESPCLPLSVLGYVMVVLTVLTVFLRPRPLLCIPRTREP